MKRTSLLSFSLLIAVAFTFAAPPTQGGGGGRGGGARGGGGGGGGMPAIERLKNTADLVKPTTPTKATDPDGFIQRWLILDPIPAQGVTQNEFQAVLKTQFFPNQLTIVPRDGQTVTTSNGELTWHAIDTLDFKVNLYHFGPMIGKPTDNVFFWAVTLVNCPEEIKGARLAVGSNDASVWWVNGQEVIGLYGDRPADVDDGVSKRLTLKKGINVVRGAIHNRAGQADFLARFLDANDNPIKNLTVTLNPDTK